MKKIFLLLTVGLAVLGCNRQGKWNAEQRKAAREMLQEWRDMIYLQDMTDAEFVIFTDNVTDILQAEYPSYAEFIAMPMAGDSVQVVVVAAIAADIQANNRNMRHIFPYKNLVKSGVLPQGLNRDAESQFYTCLAGKINGSFGSLQAFIWGAINSTVDDQLIAGFQQQCAAPFWDTETITVVEETTN